MIKFNKGYHIKDELKQRHVYMYLSLTEVNHWICLYEITCTLASTFEKWLLKRN